MAGIFAFLSGFFKPLRIAFFKHFLAAVQQPLRAFPSGYWLKRGNFHPFSLKGGVSVNIC
jgi:hypothetical protein